MVPIDRMRHYQSLILNLPSPRPGRRGLSLCAGLLFLVAGCRGSGEVRFVSLHPKEIDPPATGVWRMAAQECYWWVDETGELNIALTCPRRDLILGKYGYADLDISFVLEKPPAGSGRNYTIGLRETRAVLVAALARMRFVTTKGILAVTVRDDGTLKGSFRLWMTSKNEPNVFSLLPSDPGGLLCFGEFTAVPNAERGKMLRARTEADGWTRGPSPIKPVTSQPAAGAATQPGAGV